MDRVKHLVPAAQNLNEISDTKEQKARCWKLVGALQLIQALVSPGFGHRMF
jgi:hypothetical protein